jgi:two-component system cell cycle sensor histidine kinase/response regulator CckA
VAVERNITEDLRLAEQVEYAQKMESLGRVADGMAHDFNNMVSVALGQAELALSKVDPSDPLHYDLQQVHKAATRCLNIGRQVLALGRKQTIVPQVLDVNETAEGMVKMLRHLVGADIDLAWLPGTDVWPIRMDPSQIDQILARLCINAREAIPGEGVVAIETSNVVLGNADCAGHEGFVPGEYILLSVSNYGAGISKRTVGNLFEPSSATKTLNYDTGPGLASVFAIVKQNDGLVDVFGDGKGTTFKIYLPRHKGDTVDSLKGSIASIPPGSGETVLVVEDDVAVLDLSKTMLERLGYAVLTASTTTEAMRLVRARGGEIRLLITEVVMPEMKGRDLADQVHILFPGIKTLFTSGYRVDANATGGVPDEGLHAIQKPFTLKDLAIKVREALEQQ